MRADIQPLTVVQGCLLCGHDQEGHSVKYGQVRCIDCPDGVCLCSCAGCKDNRNTDGAA